jgi:ATP-dependent Zn protease
MLAMRKGLSPTVWILLALVVVLIIGPGLLYAYRSQSPAMQTIPVTQAVSEIQAGQVTEVVIEENRATLTLTDGSHQVTNMAFGDETLLRAVVTRNQSDPAHPVQVRTQPAAPNLLPPLLGLTPLLLLIALVVLASYAFARARAPDPYERLARLADLRDRNVITEDEFQREKRKLLG